MENLLEIDTGRHIVYPHEGLIWNKQSERFTGRKTKNGYLQFWLNGSYYSNHRYIWEQYHGVKLKSDEHINHKNWVTDDNRVENLEVVTRSQNNQWTKKRVGNISGFKGVSFDKYKNKHKARIYINGKNKHLGYFHTPELAYEVWKAKARELNETGDYKYFIED